MKRVTAEEARERTKNFKEGLPKLNEKEIDIYKRFASSILEYAKMGENSVSLTFSTREYKKFQATTRKIKRHFEADGFSVKTRYGFTYSGFNISW